MDVRDTYEAPTLSDIGSLIELTQGGVNKTVANGDTLNGTPVNGIGGLS